MSQLHQDLIAARALILDELNWVQGSPALDDRGNETDPDGEFACCFSLDGAIKKACRTPEARRDVNHWLATWARDLEGFNDDNSHDDVIELLSTAIKACAELDEYLTSEAKLDL